MLQDEATPPESKQPPVTTGYFCAAYGTPELFTKSERKDKLVLSRLRGRAVRRASL